MQKLQRILQLVRQTTQQKIGKGHTQEIHKREISISKRKGANLNPTKIYFIITEISKI